MEGELYLLLHSQHQNDSAFRWAAVGVFWRRKKLCVKTVNCDGHSHKMVSKTNKKMREKGEPKQGIEPMSLAYQPSA